MEFICSVNCFTGKDGTHYYQFGYTDLQNTETTFCDIDTYNIASSILGNSNQPVPCEIKWARGYRGNAVVKSLKSK